MALTNLQEVVALRASRQSVVSSLQDLKYYFRGDRWLGLKNRYLRDTSKKVDQDITSNKLVNKHLAEYVAASALLHCADGWGFLSRAVNSHIVGNAGHSRHFAYYAELRAAMSILASEGFGIFNRKHIVVDDSATCHRLPGKEGTHQITWNLLDYWAGTPAAIDLLGQSMEPGGRRLSEWLAGFAAGASAGLIGSEWLRTWGLDIQQLAKDHESRNEASYRPSRLRHVQPLDSRKAASFLLSLWSVFEPSGLLKSSSLDQFLLRLALEKAFQGIYGRRKDRSEFKVRLGGAFRAIGMDGNLRDHWERFLLREISRDDPDILSQAKRQESSDRPRHHLQVIARSALLLRVASGSSAALLREAGITRTDIRFWWAPLGEECGLWSREAEPQEFSDLWADIDDAVQGVNGWLSDGAGSGSSRSGLIREMARELAVLSSFERAIMWGTAL